MKASETKGASGSEVRVIFASSLGTVFEWYDFYLYGSLAAIIAKHFFVAVNEATSFIFALLAFAAGFLVRPFGAIVFGRLGDMVGVRHGETPYDWRNAVMNGDTATAPMGTFFSGPVCRTSLHLSTSRR